MPANRNYHPTIPQASIRSDLEHDAWIRHPRLARRLAQQRRRRLHERRSLRWQDRALLIIGITLMFLLLIRLETAVAQEGQWGLELHTDTGGYESLSLDTAVQVEITGLTARVYVIQSFRNDGEEWAEGIYRFPLPGGAAVDRLYIKVGDRILEGEIQERLSAQRTYQKASAQGKTASLVEQDRPNQFTSRLANIGPGEEIRIMIGFLVDVEFRDGVFSLRLPTTFNQRWGSEIQPGLQGPVVKPVLVSTQSRADLGLEMEIELMTDIGFAAIESRYHDIEIQPGAGGYHITLLDGLERTDRDFELAWYPDLQAVPQSSLMTWDDGDAVYAQLMLMPPAVTALDPQPREVIFIIDTSGSMEGASLVQAKAALMRGLEQLGEHDRFNLVQFNNKTESLFNESVPATSAYIQQARQYIHMLVANGGTVMAPALTQALTMPEFPGLMRQVVFVTDGSVGNERELLAHIANLLDDSRLFTVGIGSAPNSWFMRKASEIGRGSHTHIGKLDEVEERMNGLWTRIRLPAIQDICVDWGQPAEFYPEIIPDLYAGEPLWLVARLRAYPSQIELCGQLNGQYWSHQLPPGSLPGNDTLATLWAHKKIEALQDSLAFGADPGLMREQVTQVALDYRLLTPYTSLVAVDRTPVRQTGETMATGHIPSLLPAGNSTHTAGYPATATGWKTQLSLSFLVLLVAGWLFWNPGTRMPIAASRAAR